MTEPSIDWDAVLRRESFQELTARNRAFSLLDQSPAQPAPLELLGPFDRVESPWLAVQGVVPQSDDGVVIVKGAIGGQPVVVAAIEQAFQGGGIGEVSGAKIAAALALAVKDNLRGVPTAAVLLIESGGVRLQEANLGLATVAEICASLLQLRHYRPVVALITGPLGSFGGMSIVAGLCSSIIMTRESRLGLNGPEVIESEAGVQEFDAGDRALIWAIHGGAHRVASHVAAALEPDDVAAIRHAVTAAIGTERGPVPLSADLPFLTAHLAAHTPPSPSEGLVVEAGGEQRAPAGRGVRWTTALAASPIEYPVRSIMRTTTDLHGVIAAVLTVVPDPTSPFHRARNGEVGLIEALCLARQIRAIITRDEGLPPAAKTPIVAVVDLPSQAYGQIEERVGLHAYLAAAVDGYATARTAGHPVVALVVGTALSGGFLAHGLQADRILALDDPGVEIHAMHREAAARITRRTVEELDDLATRVAPLSYDIRRWATLGLSDGLLAVADANEPEPADIDKVSAALADAIAQARSGPHDLSTRWEGPAARSARAATVTVRSMMAQQWT